MAIHYWEGRWLLETKELSDSEKKGQSKKRMEARWQRYAMLTPCFVSTFFMLPKFFQYSIRDEKQKGFNDLPHLGFIDILIVEESGQVPSEIGGASFALAKNSIVVGDILQIPPVRNITGRVDIGNMQRFDLIKNWEDEEKIKQLHDTGVTASLGCVMKVAQSRSFFLLPGHQERGMFLAEHRRCFDEIISYSNELAYRGKLIPLRGSPGDDEFFLPVMGYANINSSCDKIKGSRINSTEAQVIAEWLGKNREKIETRYGKIQQSVGIITPFAAQKLELVRALKKEKIDCKDMKVGTIHALQGAERDIIIFSPVYGFDDERNLWFIDHEINMLNVAVSRAKDSFLVFGNMCLFNPGERTPSAILARFLFKDDRNELADVSPLKRKDAKDVEHITGVESHCKTLAEALGEAESSVLIVSPFISIHAVNHDQLGQEIKKVVDRGVEVKVYTDRYLDKQSNSLKPAAAKGRAVIRESGAKLIEAQGIHNKTLCVDECYLVEGSFNWLSAARDPSSPYYRYDVSLGYRGGKVAEFIRQITRDMEYIVKMGEIT